MAIEKRGPSVVATGCPLCEEPLDDQQSLARHLETCPALGGNDGDE